MFKIRTRIQSSVLIMSATAAGLAAFAAVGTAARAAQYTAVDLYPLQPPFGWYGAGPYVGQNTAFGGQVVGGGAPDANSTLHAVVWNSDGSAHDLNLNGFDATAALGTDGIHQFGYAKTGQAGIPPIFTPVVWSGSAASATFLNKQGFASALLFAGGGGQFVGSGQVQTAGSEHALLWNSLTARPIDLNPTNLCCFEESIAIGASGGQQVGWGGTRFSQDEPWETHALLWTGSASSAVDLNPNIPGINQSEAFATDGRQQVGYGFGVPDDPEEVQILSHALLGNGTDNAVDLNPPAFYFSIAYGVRNGKQVGVGTMGNYGDWHAMLWSGTAASAIDLHALLPNSFSWSMAETIDDAGVVFGVAINVDGQYHAVKWLPVVCSIAPDLDHDCDVDAQDVAAFMACASRAGVPVSAACHSSDFDGDGDADMSDFGTLQRCYGNAVPNCVN